jgi:hypothetical protein
MAPDADPVCAPSSYVRTYRSPMSKPPQSSRHHRVLFGHLNSVMYIWQLLTRTTQMRYVDFFRKSPRRPSRVKRLCSGKFDAYQASARGE